MATTAPTSTQPPGIRRVALDQPWVWLTKGWSDLRRAPAVSLAYGAVFALAGWLVTAGMWSLGWIYAVLPLASGFLLVGPILAVGLYEVSRRLAAGEPVGFDAVLAAFKANGSQIALMGVALLLFLFAWIRLAVLIFMLFFGIEPPNLDRLVDEAFFSADSLPFLIFGNTVGAVLAGLVFAISAVSIPLLLDRPQANVVDAITTSVAAVFANVKVMLFWAALIVLFIGAGLATLYVGLIVTLPLIGHATWHAYKDLIE